jgi:hypothetical protein
LLKKTPIFLLLAVVLYLTFAYSCKNGGGHGAKFQIISTYIPAPVLNIPYSLRLLASDGFGNVSWTVSAGTLPDNMFLDAEGTFNGAPSALGNWSVTISASAGKHHAAADFVIEVRPLPAWTVMVYLDGDHNLERHALRIFQDLERAGSSRSVNIIAQIDRSEGYDSSLGNWSDTRRYYILENATTGIDSALLEICGELDMSCASVLADFVASSAALLPASHYALFIYDHGDGWKAGLLDNTTGATMDLPSLITAFDNITTALGKRVEVVGLDECIMACVEVAGALSPYADRLIASQRFIHKGLDYGGPLSALRANPLMTGAQLSKEFVVSYGNFTTWSADATLAAIDLSKIGNLISKTNAFFAMLNSNADSARMSKAVLSAEGFSPLTNDLFNLKANDYADIANFAFIVSGTSGNAALLKAAEDLSNAAKECVLLNFKGPMAPCMEGISIYCPVSATPFMTVWQPYNEIFSMGGLNGAKWPDFYAAFYNVRDAWIPPVISTFKVLENTCIISSSQNVRFSVSATKPNAWCLDAKVISADNSVWDTARYTLSTTLSNGQQAISGNWADVNEFTWDGRVWALGNGSVYAPFTAVYDQKNKGVIRGRYSHLGKSGDFTMYFNDNTFKIATFTDETWSFQNAPPEGMILEPWILKDTAGVTISGACPGGGILVGSGGVSVSRRPAPAGNYRMVFKLRDLIGVSTSTRQANIIVQE